MSEDSFTFCSSGSWIDDVRGRKLGGAFASHFRFKVSWLGGRRLSITVNRQVEDSWDWNAAPSLPGSTSVLGIGDLFGRKTLVLTLDGVLSVER